MKQTSLLLVATMLLVAFFASCKKGTDNLTNAIPASAMTVIHIDTKSLLKKADYKPLDNKALKGLLDEQKQNMSVRETELMAKIEGLLKNPNNSGLDIIEDCFIYMDSATIGVLWGVNDADKFKDLLVKTFEMPEQTIVVEDDISILDFGYGSSIGWTKDKFLILSYSGTSYIYGHGSADMPDLKALLKKQLKQSSGESINSNKAFADFMSTQKDISVFYSYDNVMGLWTSLMNMRYGGYYNDAVSGFMGMFNKAQEYIKGMNTGTFISFEKGEITMENKMYYASSDNEKKFTELSDKLTADIKGDHLKYIADKPIFLFTAGMKGEGVYDYFTELGMMDILNEEAGDELRENGIDLKAIISSLEGDVTFALNSLKSVTKKSEWSDYEYNEAMPEFTVFVDAKDTTPAWSLIRTTLDAQIAAMADYDPEYVNIFKLSEDTYSIKVDNITMTLGVKDKTFYLTNKEAVQNALASSGSDNAWASQAKGKRVYMYGDLRQLQEPIRTEMKDEDENILAFINEGFGLLGDYDYAIEKNMNGKGKLEITDNNGNSLAVIVRFIDKIITYAIEENM